MVLTISPVTTVVVRDIGKRREGIGELKLVNGCYYIVVGIDKDEVVVFISVNKDSCLTWCAEVTCRVIFTVETCREDRVHEHVRHRVGLCFSAVTEAAVYCPYMNTLRNFLVSTQ